MKGNKEIDMKLEGKAALITGGGTGLGRAIALQLAREGVNLAINYSRSAEDAQKTAADAGAMGVTAVPLKADVSIPEEAERLVTQSAELFGGRLDILVNNAATTKFVAFQDLDGLDHNDFLRMFETNALSIFFASRAAAKIMNSRGGRAYYQHRINRRLAAFGKQYCLCGFQGSGNTHHQMSCAGPGARNQGKRGSSGTSVNPLVGRFQQRAN
jgi:NAD(P)-dependent dehydrogenase (short-subunit alcohol dehydrogenase family)